MKKKWESLQVNDLIFRDLKYYVSGEISVKADALLKEGGGERLNYFSHCVTHCIVGNNALESDITDATELYEIPALREEWVFFSVYCNKLLSTEGFIAGTSCLFANVTACISGLSKMDSNKLWAMIIFHGGKVQSLFNRSCTHLITSKKEGAKYKRAVRHGRFIRTVTPDWVVDSVRGGIRCQEGLYHPRLLISPKPSTSTPQTTLIGADACSNPAANMSTAQILGFTDDDMDTGQLLVSSSKASAMEQLRQRMPWNQPTSNQPKIPTSTAITGSPSLQEQLQQFHLVQQRLAEAEISSSLSPAQGAPHEGHHHQEVTTQNIHKALGPPAAANQSKASLMKYGVKNVKNGTFKILRYLESLRGDDVQVGMLQKTLVAPNLHQVLHTSWKQVVLPGLNQKQQQSILQNGPQIVIQQSPPQAVSLQQGETLRGPPGHQPLEQQQFQPPHSQQQYFHIQKPQQQQHLLQQKLHPRQLLQQQPQVQNSQQLLQQQQQQLQAQNAHHRMQQQQELKLQSQNSQQLLQQQQELKLHSQNSQQLLQQQQELKLHSQNSQQLLQQQQELKLHSQNSQQLLQQQQELKLHSQNSQQLLQQQQELKLHSQNSQQLLQQQQELKLQSHNPQQMLQLQLRAPNPQQILQQQEQKFHFQQQHRELKFQSQNPRQLLQQHLRAQSSQQLLQQQEQKLHTQHLLQQQHQQQQQQLQVQKSQQMLQQHQQQQLQAQMSQKLLQEQHLQSQNPQHQEEQQLSGQNTKQQLQQQLTTQNIQQRLQQQQQQQQLQTQSPHQQAQQFHAQNPQQLLQQQQHLQNKNSQQILQQQHQLQNKNALQQQQEQKHHQFQQQNPQQLPQQNLQQQYHTQNSRQQLHHQRFQPETSQQQQQQQLHVLNVRQHLEQFAAQNSQRLQQRQIPTPKPQQQFLPQSPQHHYQLQQQQQQLQPPNPQPQLQFQAQKPMQQRQQLAPEEALQQQQQQQQPAPGTSQPQQLQRRYGLSNITNSDERLSSCVVSSTTSTSASQRQSRVQLFTGQNSNLKFAPELCLLGCVIHILDYDLTYTDNIASWKKIITDHGGHVEESYGPAVTHVICEKLSSAVAQQALRDGKRCVSGYWLNDVLFKMQVLPPWIALHFPTNLRNDKPCKHLIISISGFQDDDKCRVVFMIESIGAKYTAYFSSQNNILVCRKPQGKKYDKALEWKTPVVNTQWLSDIFLGHYKAIQQPDSPKYKIFNTPNLFKVEYGLIPHLMVAWKQPLSITQELYNKATLNPPVKKRRLEKPSSVMVAPAVIEVSLAQVEAAQKEGKPRVVLSYVNDQDTIVKRVTNLGGVVVNDVEQATHLVMSKDTITIKLVLAISLGIFIVSDSWVADSSAHQTFQDEKGYVLQTDNLKLSYDITLADTLNKPNRNEFLKGKTFYVTHGVKPSRRILHKVIETAGGSAEKEMRSFVRLKEANAENLYIVSAENDMHLLSRFSNSIGIFHPNALIWSIVTQKFILDNAEEKVPS